MKGDLLYDVVDYILNSATENELEVIRAALKRRVEGAEPKGAMGINPSRLAHEAARQVSRQLGGSIGQIREMVRNYAVDIIRKSAPELSEEQVRELLDSWVPTDLEKPERAAPAAESRKPAGGRAAKGRKLPPEAIATMIAQFVSYSTDSMSISEQVKLRDEIPDWHKRYWEQFSPRLRQLISFYLNGKLDKAEFWKRANAELGIEA